MILACILLKTHGAYFGELCFLIVTEMQSCTLSGICFEKTITAREWMNFMEQ